MRRLKKLSKRPRTSGLLAGCLAAVALLATASAASAVTYRPTRTDDPSAQRLQAEGLLPARGGDCRQRQQHASDDPAAPR